MQDYNIKIALLSRNAKKAKTPRFLEHGVFVIKNIEEMKGIIRELRGRKNVRRLR